jgi:predicted DCC family thiol-disulfide oxidoreductase YuxK
MTSGLSHPQPDTPVILFDGECSLCTAQAGRLEVLARQRVRAMPLQNMPLQNLATADPRLTRAELMREIKLLMPDGRVFGGAEAIAQLAIQGRPVMGKAFQLYYLPGIRWLADRVYASVARHRTRLSRGRAVAACESGTCPNLQ